MVSYAQLAAGAAIVAALLLLSSATECEVTEWNQWSSCIGSCFLSMRARNRDVTRPAFPETRAGRLAMEQCPPLYEVQQCVIQLCPENASSPSNQLGTLELTTIANNLVALDAKQNNNSTAIPLVSETIRTPQKIVTSTDTLNLAAEGIIAKNLAAEGIIATNAGFSPPSSLGENRQVSLTSVSPFAATLNPAQEELLQRYGATITPKPFANPSPFFAPIDFEDELAHLPRASASPSVLSVIETEPQFHPRLQPTNEPLINLFAQTSADIPATAINTGPETTLLPTLSPLQKVLIENHKLNLLPQIATLPPADPPPPPANPPPSVLNIPALPAASPKNTIPTLPPPNPALAILDNPAQSEENKTLPNALPLLTPTNPPPVAKVTWSEESLIKSLRNALRPFIVNQTTEGSQVLSSSTGGSIVLPSGSPQAALPPAGGSIIKNFVLDFRNAKLPKPGNFYLFAGLPAQHPIKQPQGDFGHLTVDEPEFPALKPFPLINYNSEAILDSNAFQFQSGNGQFVAPLDETNDDQEIVPQTSSVTPLSQNLTTNTTNHGPILTEPDGLEDAHFTGQEIIFTNSTEFQTSSTAVHISSAEVQTTVFLPHEIVSESSKVYTRPSAFTDNSNNFDAANTATFSSANATKFSSANTTTISTANATTISSTNENATTKVNISNNTWKNFDADLYLNETDSIETANSVEPFAKSTSHEKIQLSTLPGDLMSSEEEEFYELNFGGHFNQSSIHNLQPLIKLNASNNQIASKSSNQTTLSSIHTSSLPSTEEKEVASNSSTKSSAYSVSNDGTTASKVSLSSSFSATSGTTTKGVNKEDNLTTVVPFLVTEENLTSVDILPNVHFTQAQLLSNSSSTIKSLHSSSVSKSRSDSNPTTKESIVLLQSTANDAPNFSSQIKSSSPTLPSKLSSVTFPTISSSTSSKISLTTLRQILTTNVPTTLEHINIIAQTTKLLTSNKPVVPATLISSNKSSITLQHTTLEPTLSNVQLSSSTSSRSTESTSNLSLSTKSLTSSTQSPSTVIPNPNLNPPIDEQLLQTDVDLTRIFVSTNRHLTSELSSTSGVTSTASSVLLSNNSSDNASFKPRTKTNSPSTKSLLPSRSSDIIKSTSSQSTELQTSLKPQILLTSSKSLSPSTISALTTKTEQSSATHILPSLSSELPDSTTSTTVILPSQTFSSFIPSANGPAINPSIINNSSPTFIRTFIDFANISVPNSFASTTSSARSAATTTTESNVIVFGKKPGDSISVNPLDSSVWIPVQQIRRKVSPDIVEINGNFLQPTLIETKDKSGFINLLNHLVVPTSTEGPHVPCAAAFGNKRCCRAPVRSKCPNGKPSQTVMRWFRVAGQSECSSYNYGYCGLDFELDDQPIKFEEECYDICYSDVEKQNLPIFNEIQFANGFRLNRRRNKIV